MFSGDTRAKLLTLGAMCFALFMAMLDNTVVNVALPHIQRDLEAPVSSLQWIVDAYVLLFASLMLTGGTLGDIFGRKRLFQIGLLIFTAGSFLCGVAGSTSMLIGGRALQGVGAAALLPGTLSILTNTFPDPRERAQAIGIWAGVSALALALGPVVGGLLVDSVGWQSVFFLNVPIGILAFFVARRVVAESSHPEGRRIDLPGQMLAIVGLASLTYALIEGNNHGWTSGLILSLFGVAGAALVVFVVVELRSTSPMLQLSFFRNPTFTASNTVAALVSFGMFGIFFFVSLFFQNVHGYSAVETGVRFLPQTAAVIVVAPLAGRLAGRFGSRWPMAIGLTLVGTGLLLFTRFDQHSSYSSMWWNFTMMGIGMGLTMTPMTAAVMGTVPPARAGMASAVTNTSREVGGVFGIALLGAIVTSRMTGTLTERLSSLGLPAGVRDQIVEEATRGGGDGRAGAPAAIVEAFRSSYVDGMHLALLVAGIALLAGAVVAATFVRNVGRETAVAGAAGEGAPEDLAVVVG